MEFNEVIKGRYSCKNFSDQPLEASKLEAILEAGRLAPTAKNSQEQHVYVCQSQEALEKIDAITPCRYHAPVVLMVAYDKNNVFNYPGGASNSGAEDATIVATHLALAAYNEGVDGCWLNFFDPAKAKELFNLPENEEVVMLLDLGYGKEGTKPLPNHDSRKPLTQTVTYL